MDEKKQDDQLELTYSNYVRTQDVTLKTCRRRWMVGRSGERGSGISVLAARLDDDDDDDDDDDLIFTFTHSFHTLCKYMYMYRYTCVCVCVCVSVIIKFLISESNAEYPNSISNRFVKFTLCIMLWKSWKTFADKLHKYYYRFCLEW